MAIMNNIQSECYICRKFGPDRIKNCRNPFLDLLEQVMENYPLLYKKKKDLLLILSELYRNALEHGVLKLSPALNSDLTTIEQYVMERKRAIENLTRGWITICLNFKRFHKKGMFIIRIEDSGSGFDYRPENESVPDGLIPNGRGIILVKSLCDQLEILGNGNIVRAVYCFDL